jgi:hypothetical protein
MFTLIRKSADVYILVDHKQNSSQELDQAGVICYLRDQEISFSEIETALTSLIRNNHAVAEFGTFGGFMYSRAAQIAEPISQ